MGACARAAHVGRRSVDIRQLRLVTPCFAGSADATTLELRATAMLGMMRMWWRAAQGGFFLAGGGGLRALKARERELFGASADERGGGQGRFISELQIEAPPAAPVARLAAPLRNLAGRGGLNRGKTLSPGDEQSGLILSFKRTATEADRNEANRALNLWLSLGGLGLNARRGFGSLLDVSEGAPRTEQDFFNRVKNALPSPRALPRPQTFQLFSDESWVRVRGFASTISAAEGLERIASEIGNSAKTYTVPASSPIRSRRENPMNADEFLSDQIGGRDRQPSPIHIHVAPLQDSTLVLFTHLPCVGPSPSAVAVPVASRIAAYFSQPRFAAPIWP